MKANTTISLDIDIILECKSKGINRSKVCNDALRSHLGILDENLMNKEDTKEDMIIKLRENEVLTNLLKEEIKSKEKKEKDKMRGWKYVKSPK